MSHQSAGEPSPRGRVLVTIEDAATPITSGDIADILRLHPSTVRSHLRKLVANGQVVEETSTTRRRGRPRKTYRPAPPGPITSLLTALVTALGDDEHDREQRAASAGRLWAKTITNPAGAETAGPPDPARSTHPPINGLADPLATAASVLIRLGFEIQSMSSVFGVHELRVCACPLRKIAAGHPEVARGIQRGAVQQALDDAAPDLAGNYQVSSHPDPRYGDCEIIVRLSPISASQESRHLL